MDLIIIKISFMRIFLYKILFTVLFCAYGFFSTAQSYNMSNSTVTTCSGTFYDNGGTGTYSSGQDLTFTICPSTAGSKVMLNFTSFNVEDNYDYLTIYDGPNTGSPTLGTYDNGTPLAGMVQATNGNTSGCLTFVFHSDGSVEYAGWEASISCVQPGQSYNMSNSTVTACSGTFYDNGGTGTYSSSQDLTYTICPSTPGSKVTLNFISFDVEDNYDYLTVYDGPNTSSPSLGTYDNGLPLIGIVQATASNTSGCLTFVFHSDGSVQYAGWVATISCAQPCQAVQAVLAGSTPAVSGQYINICQGQTITFNGSANYPQNGTSYTQSNATSTFTWTFGDGTTATGQNVSHTYNNEGGYQVGLVVTDINGCLSSNVIDIRVRVSTTPVFAGTNANPTTICVGQSTTLTGVATPTPWSQPTGAVLAGTTFLPDGSGVSYTTGINFTNFSPGQTVNSVSDIVSVCLNMEHTFMGDLQISLSCPNGNSIVLLPYSNSGGGTILGEPVGQNLPVDDNSSNTTPGIGYDYCFSPTSTSGYIDNTANWTTVAPYTDPIGQVSTSVSQANAGTYQAYGAWTSLVGCPLNGTWTITVTDNLGADNGYIFWWGVNFSPSLYPSLWGFTPTIVSQTWSGPGLAPTGTNPVTTAPNVAGTNTYTYSVTDNYGCTYDTTVTVNVNPGPTITVTPASASICSGTSTTLTASGASTYSWMPGSLTGASVSVSPTNTTTYTVTGTSAGCIGTNTVTVTVKPNPVITPTAAPSSICGGSSSSLSATSSVAGTTYTWMPGSLSGSPVNVTPATNTTYTVTGTAAGCSGVATVSVSIGSNPSISAPANVVVCSGAAVPAGSITSTPAGATYTWTNSNPAIGLAASGTGQVPGFTATNSSGMAITGSITVTPAIGSCVGTPVTYTITVNPLPVITAPANITVCSGTAIPAGSIASTPAGATYAWTNSNTAIGLAASGTGQVPGFAATNASSTAITGTITVTPAIGTCAGTPVTYTITVNPLPVITAPANITVCSGTAIPAGSIASTPSGATYTWTNSNTAIGLAANGAGQVPGFTATNASSTAITGTITVTPAIGTCVGTPVTYTITVNPLPVITAPANITVCSGAAIPAGSIASTPAGATYTWTNSNTAIGLAASGTGQVPGFTASNVSTSAITGTITITPAMGTCVGTPVTYTITITPLPVITAPANITLCSGTTIPAGNITSTPAGATYTWTNTNTAIGLAASGTGQVPGFTATNSTSTSITGSITVTPAIGSCVGTPVTYTITVNPLPVINPPASITVCSGVAIPAGSIASTPAGATYTWTNSNNAIGLAASGTGQVPGFTANNAVTASITGTITVTPAIGTCVGIPVSYTITVKPIPSVTVPASITICNGGVIAATSFTSPVAGATYTWTNSNTAIGLGASGSGNISGFNATNSTTDPITATVTVTPSANGCTGISSTYTITVNPTPGVVVPANIHACPGDVVPGSVFTSPTNGSTFAWTNSSTTIGLASSGTGNVPSFTTLNTGTTPVVATITVTPTANACTGTPSSYTITVNPLPVITFSPMPQVCHTSPSFTLGQASPPGGTYSGNGITGASFDPAVAGIGIHTITYNYTNPVTGCSNSDTSQIVINGFLTITVTPNNPFVCNGNSVLLMANGAYNFTWLPNTGLSSTTGSNVVAAPVSTTTYTVSGTNPDGCMGSTSVIVSVYNTPVLSVSSLPSEGCSPLDVTFGFAPLGPIDTNTLMWNFGDLSSADNTSVLTTPTHTFFNNGNYTIYLSALTTDGCPVSATDTVKVYLKPIADFYNNPIVAYSDNPNIDFIDLSTNATAWEWNFGDAASYNNNYSDLQNPTHIFTGVGTYVTQLIVYSNQSCSDTVEKPVTIYPEIIVYIPNAFTPNSNGLNETFKPIMSGIDEAKYDFYIYDRWGRILFQTNDANAAWDGKYNGKDCELGVYVYFILYTSMTGEKFKLRGHVTIIR